MKTPSHLFLAGLALLILNFSSIAQDTFSIVAVDPETGEVGSAGASCVDASAFGGVILLSGIIPGRGGVNAQATVCLPVHFNLVNAIDQMDLGKSPDEIITYLVANDACGSGNQTNRQYGIVDFDMNGNPRSAAFTGSNCITHANHRTGTNYAIQGNILLGPEILDSMEARFLNTSGPLAKRLMAAMQGANVPGADTRCLNQGTSSKSAFLRVAKPNDSPDSFYLQLNIPIVAVGVEPIDSLQKLFDEWMGTSSVTAPDKKQPVRVYPNPVRHFVSIEWSPDAGEQAEAVLTDITGRELSRQFLNQGKNRMNLPPNSRGKVLLLHIRNQAGSIIFSEKIVVQPE